MSTGAYAFLLFGEPEQLIPGIEAVRTLPAVTAWHAVDGHYHLALVLSSSNADIRETLRSMPGVREMLFCPVEKEFLTGFTAVPELCHAWLTIEIDAGRRDELARKLQEIDGARIGALAFGECGCVAAVSGESFEQVDRAVDRGIRPLDGVLRVKRDWIIDLTQL
jgi:hypothetical protein